MAINLDFVDKFARADCLKKLADNEKIKNDINISNKKIQKLSRSERQIVEFETKEPQIVYFKKHETVLGIIVLRLLESRFEAKRQMKLALERNDYASYIEYDAKQRSIKLQINTLYGNLGCQTSQFYLEAVAAATTSIGRQSE